SPPPAHPHPHSFPTRRSSDLSNTPFLTLPPSLLLFVNVKHIAQHFSPPYFLPCDPASSFQRQSRRWAISAERIRNLHSLVQWRRSEEHTSELQSRENLVCRLL